MIASPQISNSEITEFSLMTSMRLGLYLWYVSVYWHKCLISTAVWIVRYSFMYWIHAL